MKQEIPNPSAIPERAYDRAKIAVLSSALGIGALPEPDLYQRLEKLYLDGFMAARAELLPIIEALGSDLSSIVVPFVLDNPEACTRAIEATVRKYVVVTSSGSTAH